MFHRERKRLLGAAGHVRLMTGRADIDITVRNPDVVASPDGRQMLVRAEIVISIQRRVPGQPEINTAWLSAVDAMRLLSILSEFQKRFGLPSPQATKTYAPSAKERQ